MRRARIGTPAHLGARGAARYDVRMVRQQVTILAALVSFAVAGMSGCDRAGAGQPESPDATDGGAEPEPAQVEPIDGARAVPTGAGGAAPAGGEGPPLAERVYTDESMECVSATPMPKFNDTGYDHYVSVSNDCEAPVQCEISTDVDPAWIVVRIGDGESTEVKTRVAAEDGEYEPRLQCKFH